MHPHDPANSGSPRDLASSGTRGLGTAEVIAASSERIHHANLAPAGVLPLGWVLCAGGRMLTRTGTAAAGRLFGTGDFGGTRVSPRFAASYIIDWNCPRGGRILWSEVFSPSGETLGKMHGMPGMELHQLKTLLHVAELGSLSKAAERLRIAQPSLSRQVRLLEEELGVALFERHGRGMVITQAGREVLARVQRVFQELEGIRTDTRRDPELLRGTVSVGIPPTVAEIVTVPLVARIRAEQPGLTARITSAYSGYLMDWLKSEELDLMLSYNPPASGILRIEPVLVEELMLVLPAAQAQAEPMPYSALARMNLILPSRRHGLRSILEDCATQAGIKLSAVVETDSFSSQVRLVQEGFGATVLPLAPIYEAVSQGRLAAVPLVAPTPTRQLSIIFPADRPITPAAAYAAATFRAVASDLVGRGIWAGHLSSLL